MSKRIAVFAIVLVGLICPHASAELPDLVVSKMTATGRSKWNGKSWRVPVTIVVKNVASNAVNHFRVAVQYRLWGKEKDHYVRFQVRGQESSWVPFNTTAVDAKHNYTCKISGHLYLPDELRGKLLDLRAVADARGRQHDESLPKYGRVQESDETNNWLGILYRLDQTLAEVKKTTPELTASTSD